MRLVEAIFDSRVFIELFDDCESFMKPDDWSPVAGDVLVLHGGADISPTLYGSMASQHGCKLLTPSNRDNTEWNFLKKAVEFNVPSIGICRGAQLSCAFNGGTLFQHVGGHEIDHHNMMTTDGRTIATNTIHHQMMRLKGTKCELIAWANPPLSNVYEVGPGEEPATDIEKLREPEIVWFPVTKTLAFQGHPEMIHRKHPYYTYCSELVEKYILREFKA